MSLEKSEKAMSGDNLKTFQLESDTQIPNSPNISYVLFPKSYRLVGSASTKYRKRKVQMFNFEQHHYVIQSLPSDFTTQKCTCISQQG